MVLTRVLHITGHPSETHRHGVYGTLGHTARACIQLRHNTLSASRQLASRTQRGAGGHERIPHGGQHVFHGAIGIGTEVGDG